MLSYQKSVIPPGEPSLKGSGELGFVESQFGRLSVAICYDMDFPGLIREAGKNQTDLMLVPAYDWASIAETHAFMARVRAIENGFTLFRQTTDGLTQVSDCFGKISQSEYLENNQLFRSTIQIKKQSTFYSIAGDWLPILCFIILVSMVSISIKK